MYKYVSIFLILFFNIACKFNNTEGTKMTISADSLLFDFKPNLQITTQQYLGEDSLNLKIVKIAHYLDTLLLDEKYYNNYMSSEYDGTSDAEYLYYYNKNKQLVLRYTIESFLRGDTVKYQYQYYNENNDCTILVSDCRRRLKNDSTFNRHMITEDDFTEERIWKYSKTIVEKHDEQGRLVEWTESAKEGYDKKQDRYTYEYEGDKPIKKTSFFNDNIPQCTETFEYKKDTIKIISTIHDSSPIPFYIEIETLDSLGNVISRDKYDDKNNLMRRHEYSFDLDNRLIKMQCFNGKHELKVTHKLVYKSL